MGTCCSKTDNSRVEFDNINKDKDVTAAKNKNNYTKDPTNLPSGGQTAYDTDNTAGGTGHGGLYGLSFFHYSIAVFIYACIQDNVTNLKLTVWKEYYHPTDSPTMIWTFLFHSRVWQ